MKPEAERNYGAGNDLIHEFDSTRPTHYEGENDYADIHSEMYSTEQLRVEYFGKNCKKPFVSLRICTCYGKFCWKLNGVLGYY